MATVEHKREETAAPAPAQPEILPKPPADATSAGNGLRTQAGQTTREKLAHLTPLPASSESAKSRWLSGGLQTGIWGSSAAFIGIVARHHHLHGYEPMTTTEKVALTITGIAAGICWTTYMALTYMGEFERKK